MPVENVYRTASEGTLVNYDWVDVAEGVGYITLYGVGTKDYAGLKYKLHRNVLLPATIDDDDVCSIYANATTTDSTQYVKLIDLDFETSAFNYPIILKGSMFVNVPFQGKGVGCSGNVYILTTLNKLVGSTETSITTLSGANIATASGHSSGQKGYASYAMTVPRTKIKIGDKLRMTVELWAKSGGGGSPDYETGVFFNPVDDRAITVGNLTQEEGYTQMKFALPVRIDL